MGFVAINVLTVGGAGASLEQRFAGRAGMVENAPGFESFELLRPVDGTDDYLVVTHWRDRESYEAWLSSRDFARGHASSGESEARPAATGSQIWTFETVQSVRH